MSLLVQPTPIIANIVVISINIYQKSILHQQYQFALLLNKPETQGMTRSFVWNILFTEDICQHTTKYGNSSPSVTILWWITLSTCVKSRQKWYYEYIVCLTEGLSWWEEKNERKQSKTIATRTWDFEELR